MIHKKESGHVGYCHFGLELAQIVVEAHGAHGAGQAGLRKKSLRAQVLAFLSQLLRCVGAIDAAAPIFWGREIGKSGNKVRLFPPAYVKPFVKRQKDDAADTEAIHPTTGSNKSGRTAKAYRAPARSDRPATVEKHNVGRVDKKVFSGLRALRCASIVTLIFGGA